ncbi:MAG: CapA family protein, partial [Anaerolineae bacterium]
VALADLEGDGQGEVIAGSDDNNIYALSSHGRLLWRYTTGSRVTEVAAQDLDGDGSQEILAGSWDGYLYLLGGDGELRWRRALDGGATNIRVADLQSDGRGEIIVASEEGKVTAFTSGGERLWSYEAGGYIREIDVYDFEGQKKIVVGSSEGVLYLLSSEGQPLWWRDMGSGILTLGIANIEGSPKIFFGSGYDDGRIYLLDGQKGWDFATGSGVWALDTFFLDGEATIVAGGDEGTIYLLDRYGRLLGSYHVGGRIHGLLAHDLEGDGRPEIILRSGVYLYALEMTPGRAEAEAPQITPYPSLVFSASSAQDVGLVELVAVGDILLCRTVEERMNQYGVEFPFAVTGELLRSADIALGNLECPLSTRGEPIDKRFLFRAHPRNLAALSWAGIDIVSLANNHLLDFGEKAMEDTLEGLKDSEIPYVGVGLSEEEAHRPVIMEVRGVKIAFLAYAAIRWRGSPEVPTETRVAFAEIDRVQEDVRRGKEQADLVIVIMHLGTEYQSQPDAEQLAVSQAAVEAGATLVIGHHPHLVQETVPYLGGFIAYSLGDFVFDMPWEEEGAILRAFFTAEGLERAEVIPVEIVDGVQPRPLLDEEGDP